MAGRTHYDVLGVASDASAEAIRAAYHRRAREHHPDRGGVGSAAGGLDMPTVNEAYRVLYDPGRRALYDRSLGAGSGSGSGGGGGDGWGAGGEQSGPGAAANAAASAESTFDGWTAAQMSAYRQHGPARVPWRSMLFAAFVGTVGVVALAQFTGSGGDLGPDGILRNGDCVELQPNSDAREISCTGEGDLVVRAFIPFDGTCPGFTEPHRDRQGMGVACIELPDGE